MKKKTLLIALLSILIVGASQAGPTEEAAEFYEHAQSLLAEAKTKEALIELKNALQLDPNNLPARMLLGETHLKSGNAPEAEKEILLAKKMGADPSVYMLPLAKALNQQQKYQSVVKQIETGFGSKTLSAQLLFEKGRALLEMSRLQEAEKILQQSIQANPNVALTHVGLAALALKKQDFATVTNQLDQALLLDGELPEAWLYKGELAYVTGKFDQAIKHFDTALSLKPKYYRARLSRALVLMDRRDFAGALPQLQALREESNWNPQVSYLLAVALEKTGDAEGAKAEMRHASTILDSLDQIALENNPPYLLLAGMITYANQQTDQSYQYLTRYLKHEPRNEVAIKLLANSLLDINQPIKAIRLLESAIINNPDSYELHTLLGDSYVKAQQYSKAFQSYEDAAAKAPAGYELSTKIGAGHLAANDLKASAVELEKSFKNRPDTENIAATLASVYIALNNPQRAQEITEQALKHNPASSILLNIHASSFRKQGKMNEARQWYEKALAAAPDYRPAIINLAQVDTLQGKYEKARQSLDKLLKLEPENPQLLYELAKVDMKRGDTRSAIRRMEEVFKKNPKQLNVSFALIDAHISEKQISEALARALRLKSDLPENFHVLQKLATVYLLQGDKENAQPILQQASRLASSSPEKLYQVARLQIAANASDDARWALQQALTQEPENLIFLVALADLQIATGRHKDAADLIDKINRLYPKQDSGKLLAGFLAREQNRQQDAANYFRQALEISDRESTAIHLFQAQWANQQEKKALQLLENWYVKHPEALRTTVVLAQVYHSKQQHAKAQSLYEQAVQITPDDPLLLNNLANLYAETGNNKALQLAQKAFSILPENADILDTLGWLLVQSGSLQEGLTRLREASLRNADSPVIRYHLAVALHRSDKNRQALQQLESALNSRQPFTERDEAVKLQKLLSN
ncbi:MAG: PEP-CTERM system TPR-repeat protein PrsT [Chromatiales bacterium]|jgi:putative PEP-CTERM system TPR-repeat lipoprotein